MPLPSKELQANRKAYARAVGKAQANQKKTTVKEAIRQQITVRFQSRYPKKKLD